MNERLMKVAAVMGLAALLGVALLRATVTGQDTGNGKIEGTWMVTVNIDNPPPGVPPVVQAMESYIRGGRFLETGSSSSIRRGPGHGEWLQTGHREFTSTFRFFRFDANGSYAGFQKNTRTIQLSSDGTNYTATAKVENFDTNGNLLGTTSATETAQRMEVNQ